MTFRCLLAIFFVAAFTVDNWSLAQEIGDTASQIQVFESQKGSVQELTARGAFDIGNVAEDESFVAASSYTRKTRSASELDAMYAEAQKNVLNDSLRIAGISLAVIFAVIVGGLWLYNNSNDSFGERQHEKHYRRSNRRRGT